MTAEREFTTADLAGAGERSPTAHEVDEQSGRLHSDANSGLPANDVGVDARVQSGSSPRGEVDPAAR